MAGLTNRLSGAFERLSWREKVLVSTMIALVVGLVVVGGTLWAGSSVRAMETEVREDREALLSIYDTADGFVQARERSERMKKRAAQNENLNLKLAINEIAKQIEFQARDRRGRPAGRKKLADVLQFEQTQESYLSDDQGGRAQGDDTGKGYYRRDQPVALSDKVPFEAIYELMRELEQSEQLLFITDVEMTRDFRDGRIARKNASIKVSTFYYKGGDE